MIPRILHAWWGGPPMPESLQANLDRWRELHPKWTFRLWTPETTPKLRNQDLYDKPEQYSAASNPWQWRSDLARYEILYDHGGVYIDCDLEPLRPIDDLIDGHEAVIARECQRFVNNAFIGVTAKSRFMASVLKGLRRSVLGQPNARVNRQIGAYYLTRIVRRHPEVRVLPPEIIYPEHWSNLDALNEPPPPEAYTRHHWFNKQRESGHGGFISATQKPQ